jgi:streptogramin lyase
MPTPAHLEMERPVLTPRNVLRMVAWVLLALFALDAPLAEAQTIRTIAGTGTSGFSGDGSRADVATFNSPVGIHGDNSGQIWIADTGNHRIRRVTASFDTIVTYAGTGTASFTGDGAAATSATLSGPTDVFVDSTGNVWIADTGNHVIRRITTAGVISTVAGTGASGFSGDDGTATSAKLNSPAGVYVTNSGVIYIADRGNHRIRRVSTAGTITTIAGNGNASFSGDGGSATNAALSSPSDVFLDTAGVVYITDTNNHRLRAIAADSTISTIGGTGAAGFSGDGGVATNARFAFPRSVFVDTAGSIYIADRFNHRVRRINTNGNITTIAGDGVLGASGDGDAANIARLGSPGGIWLHDNRELFVGDTGNHRIRRLDDDNVIGLVGATASGRGSEVRIFRASFTGDGSTAVKGIRLAITDLSTATGLDTTDFEEFRLYESPDSLFSATDTLQGTIAAGDITLATTFTVQSTQSPVPAAGQRRHYLVTAVLADDAVESHAFRVAFPSGGLSTTIGGQGMPVRAADANKITIDVIATKLVFNTQPDGAISSNPLLTQPVVHAVDDLGFVDGGFTDVVTLTVGSGSGSLLQATATAVAGIATFSSVTYVATSDQEPFALIADDEVGGSEGDLPTTTSNTLAANTENDAPVIVALSFTIDEDDSVMVPISSMASDVDDSLSSLIFTFAAAHTQVELVGTELTIRPDPDYFGSDTLLITVEDPFGAKASDQSVLTIKAVNDRPVLTRLGRRTIDEDDTMVVQLTAQVADVETAALDIQWSFNASTGLSTSYAPETGRLTAWTKADSSGSFTLVITAFDAENLAATTLDTIDFAAVNDAPLVALPVDVSIARNSTFVLDLLPVTSDPDHDVEDIVFQLGSATGLAALLEGTVVSLTPEPGFSGLGQIVLLATDPEGAVRTVVFDVSVFSANPQPPAIATIPTQTVELDDTLNLPLGGFVTDPDHDDDLLSWVVSSPAIGTATVIDGALQLSTAGTSAYTVSLTLTVTDPDGLKDNRTISIVVTELAPLPTTFPDSLAIDTELAPLLTTFPDSLAIDITGGELLLDAFIRSGVAPSDVSWDAVADDALAVIINPLTRIVSITPANGSRAGGRIVFTATTTQQTAIDSIDIRIANVTPVIELPDLFLDAGESAQLLLDAFVTDDEDVSLVTWSAQPLDVGLTASLNQAVRALTLTAAEGSSGELSVAFAATDEQGATGLDTIRVSVRSPDDIVSDSSLVDTTGTNTAPIVGPFTVLSFLSGASAAINLDNSVTDDEPVAELRWSAEAGAGITANIDASRRLNVTAVEEFVGTTTIRLSAIDIFGARGSGTLVVEVREQVGNPMAGDFDGSGRVELDDFFTLIDHLGLTVFTPGFDARYDLNDDGRVSFDDFFLFLDIYDNHRLDP